MKDLGPQVSWRTVFIVEYLGPLLIHQVYCLLRARQLTGIQLLAYGCITFHFLKREYETLFVHRFSHTTMPLRNLVKNSAHYWILSGAWVAHQLYAPSYQGPAMPWASFWTLAFMLAELGNLYCHVILMRLRSHKHPTARAIPRGFAFDWVSCPNYAFEVGAWVAFSLLTGLLSAWVFTALATAQMYLWARKKHRAYLKEFPNYPKNRTSIFPFLP